jgi:hypothetical protein
MPANPSISSSSEIATDFCRKPDYAEMATINGAAGQTPPLTARRIGGADAALMGIWLRLESIFRIAPERI